MSQERHPSARRCNASNPLAGYCALVAQRYGILYRLGITPWEHEEAPEQLYRSQRRL